MASVAAEWLDYFDQAPVDWFSGNGGHRIKSASAYFDWRP
jgi:hypothetical protein